MIGINNSQTDPPPTHLLCTVCLYAPLAIRRVASQTDKHQSINPHHPRQIARQTDGLDKRLEWSDVLACTQCTVLHIVMVCVDLVVSENVVDMADIAVFEVTDHVVLY